MQCHRSAGGKRHPHFGWHPPGFCMAKAVCRLVEIWALRAALWGRITAQELVGCDGSGGRGGAPRHCRKQRFGVGNELCWASLNQRQGPAEWAQYWKWRLTMEIYYLASLTPGHYKSYLIFFMSLLAAGVCTPSSTDAMAMMGPCQWGSSRSRQSAESSSSHPTSQGS